MKESAKISSKPQSAAAKSNRYGGLWDSSSDNESDSGSDGADGADDAS